MVKIFITYMVLSLVSLNVADDVILTGRDTPEDLSVTDKLGTKLGQFFGDNIENIVDSVIPYEVEPSGREGRGKKKKKFKMKGTRFLVPLLIGWLLIKSIILPIALKAIAVLSGKAFVLSLMSLVLAAIMGLRRLTGGFANFNAGPTGYSKYRRKDLLEEDTPYEGSEPYKYYQERDPHIKE